jgi:hypothetical protein
MSFFYSKSWAKTSSDSLQFDAERSSSTGPADFDADFVSHLVIFENPVQVICRADLLAVDGHDAVSEDQVTLLVIMSGDEAGYGGRSVRGKADDERSLDSKLLRDIVFGDFDAEPRLDDLSIKDELGNDSIDGINGNGKPDSC